MRDPWECLLTKAAELDRVRKQVEALRMVVVLVYEEGDPPLTPTGNALLSQEQMKGWP